MWKLNNYSSTQILCEITLNFAYFSAIADVVEALIGVHLAKGGQDVAAKFLSWLGLDLNPEKEIKDIINRKDDETSPSIEWFQKIHEYMPKSGIWMLQKEQGYVQDLSPFHEKLDKFMEKVNHKHIENALGYNFRDKSFLLQAITHASYGMNMVTDSYERLEFLGNVACFNWNDISF